jgi:hypothetical protein
MVCNVLHKELVRQSKGQFLHAGSAFFDREKDYKDGSILLKLSFLS